MSWPISILSSPLVVAPSLLPISPSPRSLRYICIFLYLHAISSCPYTHSFPWSVGRASIFFVLLFLFSTCLLQSPTSLLAFFFLFSQLTISFLFTFSASVSVLPICLFLVHTTLYKISRIFLQNAKPYCRHPNPICCNTSLMNSSTTLYQSAIHQDNKRISTTSTSVCEILALCIAAL